MDTLNVMGDATEGSFETEGAGYSSQSAAELGVRLAGAGVMVVDTTKWDQTQRENVRHIMAQLGENHRVLLSAFRDKSAIVPALNQLQNNSGAELLCVSQLQDKEGLGGMYDPNSGTIHETTSSFDLKVILISLADGRIVWGNEVYVRQALTSKNRAQCEGVLFGTISK